MYDVQMWLENNSDKLYESFMESNPSYEKLLFIHKWYNPDQKISNVNNQQVMRINSYKFKIALLNWV